MELAKTYPELNLVVQDLPDVIANTVVPDECKDCIKFIAHDFFEEQQPVKGADVYFMCLVLMDWPDDKVVHAISSITDIDLDDLLWRTTRNPIVTQRLLDMGWCPTIVEQTEFSSRVALLYFLTLLGPPKDQSHRLEFGAPGCKFDDKGCNTKHVNNETFRPRHFDNGCDESCEFVAADNDEVQSIVAKGGIPIAYLNTEYEKPRIEITELKGTLQYTAFSHV
jgi:hypothetical protein